MRTPGKTRWLVYRLSCLWTITSCDVFSGRRLPLLAALRPPACSVGYPPLVEHGQRTGAVARGQTKLNRRRVRRHHRTGSVILNNLANRGAIPFPLRLLTMAADWVVGARFAKKSSAGRGDTLPDPALEGSPDVVSITDQGTPHQGPSWGGACHGSDPGLFAEAANVCSSAVRGSPCRDGGPGGGCASLDPK